MKKILLILVSIISFFSYSSATTVQGTIKKIDNNIIGIYVKPLGGSINGNTPNFNITVSIPVGGGTAPVLTPSSLIPGVGINPNPVETIAGRWVYAFVITGATGSTLNWPIGTDNLVLSVEFPSGPTSFAKVAQLNDYSANFGGISGQALFDILVSGIPYVDYNVMFYGPAGSFSNNYQGGAGNSFANAPAPLPVTLVSFKADKFQERSSHLTWATASESNSSHFLVQSSTDKKSWKNLGSVKAAGNSQLIENYEFFDYNVYNGRDSRLTVYYRLQMVDLDGQTKTSPLEAVVFGTGIAPGRDFVVYPNPASDGIQVEWDANRIDQPTSLEFFDVTGKLVYTQKVSDNTNQEYIDFGQTTIIPGLYLLRILNGEEPLDFKQIVIGQR